MKDAPPAKKLSSPMRAAHRGAHPIDQKDVSKAIERALPTSSPAQRAELFGAVFVASGSLGKPPSPTEQKARLCAIRDAATLLADAVTPPPASIWRRWVGVSNSDNPLAALVEFQGNLHALARAANTAATDVKISARRPIDQSSVQFIASMALAWRDTFGEFPSASRTNDFSILCAALAKPLGLDWPSDPYRKLCRGIALAQRAINAQT